jgi:hypothetical protein
MPASHEGAQRAEPQEDSTSGVAAQWATTANAIRERIMSISPCTERAARNASERRARETHVDGIASPPMNFRASSERQRHLHDVRRFKGGAVKARVQRRS